MRRNLLLLPLCLAFAACDAGNPVTDEGLPMTKAATERITGDVLLTWRPSTGDIVAALDSDAPSGSPDGRIDRLFVLQRRGFAAGGAESLRLRHATVTYQPGLVLIEGERGRSFALLLDDTNNSQALASVRSRPLGSIWAGYGLANKTGDFAESLATLTPAALDRLLPVCGGSDPLRLQQRNGSFFAVPRFQGTPPADAQLICDSGGAGSSSCSTSCGGLSAGKTCSVNCGTGYHSCCDLGKCKCQCVSN